MSFLLDTDICSASLKNNPTVANRFVQYGGRLHISTVTLGELFTWAKRAKASPKRRQGLLDLLKEMKVLPVDEAIAEKFGEIRAGLLDSGLNAPQMDMMNAAIALVHDLTLVTHNVTDYTNVPGLTFVDWLVP
jgi:predicted nucleic acid-binding protein